MSDTILNDLRPQRADAVTAPINEDWLAVVLGLAIFVLALAALVHVDLIGWVVTTSVWSNFGQALKATSKDFSSLGGIGALIATYVALLVVLSAGAAALKANVKRFALAFTAVFWIAYASWVIGNFANFAAVTPAEQQKFGISWSLKLTNEGGYIFALIAGLIIANFFPRFAEAMKEAVRPELYIKVAIVILGGVFAVTAAGKLGLGELAHLARRRRHRRGLSDLLGGGVFRRPQVVRLQSRMGGAARVRHLDLRRVRRHRHRRRHPRAAGGAGSGVVAGRDLRRGRSSDPAVSSRRHSSRTSRWSPAPGWGLPVKTDGAAVAAGGITESLILAKNAAEGVNYQPGWILGTAATIKVFIDIFIGIWAFVLGYIWTNHINVTPDQDKAKAKEIWQRFPKFIIGFLITFVVGLYLALGTPADIAKKVPAAIGEANTFRVIFFILTFFSIGVLSNFKTLWQEGFGKLAAVYLLSLFGFVVWVGLLISWIFFSGITPPLAS